MSDDLNSIVPVDNADARRELLTQQFEEAEQAPEHAKPKPKQLRRSKSPSGSVLLQAGKKIITRHGQRLMTN